MKKLVLGLTACWYVAVNGMNSRTLVDSVVRSPLDRSALSALVSDVITDNKKILQVRASISSKAEEDDGMGSNQLFLYRICSMLYQLSRDIRFNEVNSLNYYVYGALQGNFGPDMD